MAIEYDISGLLGKIENEGSTDAGRLTAKEFNTLVQAVGEVQNKVEGTIKGIKYNGGAEQGGQTFAEIDDAGFLKMTVADTSGYQLRVDIDNPDPYIARGATCPIKVRVSSKQVQGDDLIPATAACTVNFYLNGAATPFYIGNVYDMDSNIPGVSKELVIDLSKISGLALLTGEIENEIMIEVNNRFGKVITSYCYVKVVELSLSVDVFGVKNVFTESDKPQLIARVSGTDALVTAKVDGKEILTNGEALNGVDTNFGTAIFDNASVNTHGVHTIEVIASVIRETAEGDITISTLPQSFNYIYGTTNTRPVVMSVINNSTPEEYSNFEMSYVAYKYNPTAVAVKDTVTISLCNISYDSDGKPVAGDALITVTQDVEFSVATNSGSGDVMFSLFPVDNKSLVGKKAIVISIGDYSQITEIEVLNSSVTLKQLGGYAVYLTANNRSNDEPASTVRTWRSTGKDRSGNTLIVDAIFDDNIEFINTGSGWIADDDKNMAMHLRKGKFFTLNYCPFDENPTYNDETNRGNGRGKTISIEFATRNCLDQNSTVISCIDASNGQERGFEITASAATLKSNTFSIGANFKEDTRIKIDFVIEGKRNLYKYDTVSGKDGIVYKGESSEALAIIYVDGVYQGLKVIPNSTTFLQGNSQNDPAVIRFGSNDCDLDIYNIRIYDQALTPEQIVNNYSYDTPNFTDKIAIAKRNDIFDLTDLDNKPNINIQNLRRARPDLPFFYVKQPLDTDGNDVLLPQNKSDWLKVPFTEWKNPMNETNPLDAAVSWTNEKGRWRNQGTSSMSYPWPWRNWDWQNKDGVFTFGDGTTSSKWAQYKGMESAGNIKKITLKKDYASSEMCNNAITSEYFTDMALAIGNEYPNVMSPAQRIDGAETTPYRLTFVAVPCFLFQQFNDPTKEGTAGAGYEALGMMNLIPNKNECDHLGFSDKSGFTWETNRSQSWELADNKDDWFWYKELTGIKRNSDGTYENDLAECYEARYPKDSTLNGSIWDGDEESDFGMVVEDKATITEAQAAALFDEQRDIIEFHNWLVSVNRQIPEDYKAEYGEYRPLTGDELNNSKDWKDGPFTHDTPEYRLAKFTAESPTRLIVDQFCLYYIWREQFWAFDSGFKNLQVYTMGKANDDCAYMQWGCMVRDADTTLGIENTGKDYFPPHIEDIDYYVMDETGNISFNYGGAKGLYHSKSIGQKSGKPVLNGQLGSLWINLRDVYGPQIANIYRALSGSTKANWSGTRSIKRFRDHQEKWCENLYNFGMRQYFGGEPFTTWIESGLGDKKNSRASWLSRGFYYRNSKYNNLGDGDYCKVRACCYETPDNIVGLENDITSKVPLKFKAYIPMYVGLGASEQKMSACKNFMRITDTDNTFDVVPGPEGLDFPLSETADQNIWFYGTSQLTEIGDFARGCKIKEFASISLPKLRELNLGHEKDRDGIEYQEYYYETTGEGETASTVKKIRPFSNRYLTAMNCGTLKQLTLLDITNHTMVNAVNGLNACDQLQELYARGTDALTTINLPATTALRILYLGKNLVTLNLTNLTGIEKFELEGASSLTQLYIRNCGNYMGERSYDIMKMAIASLESVYDEKNNNNICQLTNINWQNADSSYLSRLLSINAVLSGKIVVKTLSNELKLKLIDKYGNIDDPENGLYITYIQEPIRTITLPSKLYIYEEGTYDMKSRLMIEPLTANTYVASSWKLSTNKFAECTENGIITRNSTAGDNTTSATLTVTVYQMPESDGTEREPIEVETTVYFYERLAKPGDIVFNDGTFSDELDNTKTPIGVCFYVDPTDKTKRLMCALNLISTNTGKYYIEWGMSRGGQYTTNDGASMTYYGASPLIEIPGVSYYDQLGVLQNDACYDIKAIYNIMSSGVEGDNVLDDSILYYSDDIYRDSTNPDNGYFKSFTKDTYFGDLGWKDAESAVKVDFQNGSESISIASGERVPSGYFNTISVIAHRNKALDAYKNSDGDGTFIRPAATNDYNESTMLGRLCENANGWSYAERDANYGNTYGSLMYYPAASYCFAYEPNAANLDDRFKKYNWFLPASGDLMRIQYYMYHSYSTQNGVIEEPDSKYDDSYDEPANAFANAIKLGVLKTTNIVTGYHASSTEYDRDHFICIQAARGLAQNYSKSSGTYLRPICVF